MIGFFRKLLKDRRGNALVIAGAALPLIVGAAGLANDTIQWTLWKRQLQRAADSAALAGVYGEAQGNAIGTCTNYTSATYAQPVGWTSSRTTRPGRRPPAPCRTLRRAAAIPATTKP